MGLWRCETNVARPLRNLVSLLGMRLQKNLDPGGRHGRDGSRIAGRGEKQQDTLKPGKGGAPPCFLECFLQ